MNSLAHGKNTSAIEVTNISTHGIWLLVRDKEVFISYEDFPWFKGQTVESIINVEEQGHHHFYWPDIDVDLTLESIENPDRFPLKAKPI
ncbi:DUF2442 domain-containing protein [Alkalimarinus coralli]|uniref:DUF2442 domain-containing protein n=1 Tax=Alkalimarinus coralli TaxID=2935863 RepID=UPI00202B37A0|nr:DUF2442 domain-containing protein [Alkalimarinus coralli]